MVAYYIGLRTAIIANMQGSAITGVFGWQALDSRGTPTVGCVVSLASGAQGRTVVPSGASTGRHEVRERRDGLQAYAGRGVLAAVSAVNGELADAVRGLDAAAQHEVDAALLAADGDPDLSRLGGNAVLAVSLAALLAAAADSGAPLYQQLLGGGEPLLPLPMVNILSGGAHAAGAVDIQDVLVVPIGAESFPEAIEHTHRVRRAAAELVSEAGGSSALVADEGGLALPGAGNEAALALVARAVSRAGLRLGEDAALAVDVAATQLWDGARYRLAVDEQLLDAVDLVDLVAGWASRYAVVSIEDVVAEDDVPGWRYATEQLGGRVQLLGDDLFATRSERFSVGVSSGVANAVLVKPNQAGTVSRAAHVVRLAHEAGYATVLSARSGDTEDTWLADLAVGWRTGQIKVGSTTRSERTAKWNRLLELAARPEIGARYAGRAALAPRPAAAARPTSHAVTPAGDGGAP